MRVLGQMRSTWLCALAFLAIAPAAGAQAPAEHSPPPAAVTAMPDSVRGYVRDAMALFRQRSLHRDTVDWAALEDSVLARAGDATTPAGTWQALNWALRRVDPHSFLMAPQRERGGTAPGSGASPSLSPQSPPMPTGRLLAGGIGFLSVPGHMGPNRPAYVDSLHAALMALDRDASCGWIVDLRENTGGNMWPMLAGIGPLLGAEVVGAFDPAPPGQAWRYRDGRSWPGDSTPPAMAAGWGSAAPRPLAHADAPVAVLTGRRTGSSGEMTLVAFLGRPNLWTFGDSTAGYTSANAGIPLRDGATMIVTVSYARDRLGRRQPLRVGPDELVTTDPAAVVYRAAAWLRRQGSCAFGPGNSGQSATQTALGSASDTLWLLAPDPSADAVRADDTEQSLIARYGAANVRRELVDEGEGMLNPGTALFPDDSSRRLTILWRDTVSYRNPERVAIDGAPSRWFVAPGIRMGTTLEELERMNGGPFALLGFGGHLPGYVQDWQGGALAHFDVRDDPYGWHRVAITLQPTDSLPADADPDRYTNEPRYLSSDPGLRKLRPRVTSIGIAPR